MISGIADNNTRRYARACLRLQDPRLLLVGAPRISGSAVTADYSVANTA
jgi:hypothetical protein